MYLIYTFMIVYLISSEINGNTLYKIGYTRRKIEKRIKEFKTGNASDFRVIDTYESIWSTKIEASLHHYFASKKVSGEWFDLTNDDIINFKKLCETTNNSLELLSKTNTYIIDRGGF